MKLIVSMRLGVQKYICLIQFIYYGMDGQAHLGMAKVISKTKFAM